MEIGPVGDLLPVMRGVWCGWLGTIPREDVFLYVFHMERHALESPFINKLINLYNLEYVCDCNNFFSLIIVVFFTKFINHFFFHFIFCMINAPVWLDDYGGSLEICSAVLKELQLVVKQFDEKSIKH